jgi:hypothetical protein
MLRLPPGQIVWPIVRISALAWAVIRAVVTAAIKVAGVAPEDASLRLLTSVVLVLAVGVVALVDNSLARERIWNANLGLGRRRVFLLAVASAGALEMGFRVITWLAAGG